LTKNYNNHALFKIPPKVSKTPIPTIEPVQITVFTLAEGTLMKRSWLPQLTCLHTMGERIGAQRDGDTHMHTLTHTHMYKLRARCRVLVVALT